MVEKVMNKNWAARRTEEAIRGAFAKLLAEKGELAKISVSELCREAEITRATFYAHYDNIYGVAVAFQEEILDSLSTIAGSVAGNERAGRYFDAFFEFLTKHDELYHTLLSSDAPMIFLSGLNRKLNDLLLSALTEAGVALATTNPEKLKMDATFFTDGAMYMILKHFRGEIRLSLGEINLYLQGRFREMFE